VGSLVRVPLGHRTVRGMVVSLSEGAGEGLESIKALVVAPPLAPPVIRDLLRWLAIRYAAPQPAAFERVVPPRVRVEPRAVMQVSGGPAPNRLLDYRYGAELARAIESGRTGVWCLRSMPGESRGQLIGELVSAAGRAVGGAAVVMVPEVRYGSRVLDAMQQLFPQCVRLDSGRPEGERSAGWLAVANGHGLAAGGRAAVLAPAPRLRLIVVDEEHHRTYKEDRSPRYDARRVAIERARRQGAACVLISLAPLVETGAQVRAGRFGLAEPSRASDRAARPIVEVVERPADRQLSHSLHRRIHDVLSSGGKVAVLVPQRGFARSWWCAACRRSVRCPVCEAGVRLETGGSKIRCPRCGFGADAPERCPACGAGDFLLVGAGSERSAEQLQAAFPRWSVERVDPDTLEAGEGQPATHGGDIYLTTWVGTKPALRPDVSLVAVVDADAFIRLPDFRAAEIAYRALAEMAEWAGPAASGGRLMLQSAQPSHHAIQAVVRGDYGFFLDRELRQRKELSYPPFAELVKVRSSGTKHRELIARVAHECRVIGALVLGPIDVREGSRETPSAEVLVKHPDAQQVAECLRGILRQIPVGTRLRVDVDPR
jgi:primosomal protein N' (replication factor Y) (superfamily II helicase)